MHLDDLKNFLELSRVPNMTHASDHLGISQPALSRSLARLEKDLGHLLFDRNGRRLSLNARGEVLVPHAARIVSELQDAKARLAALQDPEEEVVSLSYVTSFGSWLVPSLIEDYRSIAPSVRFILDGGPADHVLESVRDGGADIGFLSPRPETGDVIWTELVRQPLALTVPPGHPLAGRSQVTAEDLHGLGFVMFRPEYGLRQIADRLFRDLGVSPHIAMEVTEMSTLRALVATGAGAAIMPVETPPSTSVAQIPLAAPVTRTAGMIVSANRGMPPAVARFARFVGEWGSGR